MMDIFNPRTVLWILFLFLTCMCVSCDDTVSEEPKPKGIDKNEMGMGVLYDMVHVFLGDILHKEKISESFLNLSTVFVDGKLDEDAVTDWENWLEYLTGFAVCLGIGVVYLVFMPLIGFIFCCCRCCGKCGGRRKPVESKRATCKRRSYCFLVTLFNTVVLAGVVCAFVCNSLVYKHLQNDNNEGTIGHLKAGLGGVESFLNDSYEEAATYITTEYDETSLDILTRVNDSALSAVDNVLKDLNATKYLQDAEDIAKNANATKDELEKASTTLGTLAATGDELKKNLTDIKNDISGVCNKPGSNCQGFNPAEYNTDADFSGLESLKDETDKVAGTMDMDKYLDQADSSIEEAKTKAKNEVSAQTDEATKAVDDVGKTVKEKIAELEKEKNSAVKYIPDAYKDLDDHNEEIRKYSKYIYYGGMGICCVYLLIVLFYYVGIVYGLCGERPGDGAPCCHTGVGANFLMAGVAFTFIFSWILMLICIIFFMSGGPMYTEVCRYFEGHNPEEVRFLDDVLNNAIDFKELYEDFPKDFSVATSLKECQNNASLYSALHLDNVVNLDDMMNIDELKKKLDDLKEQSFTLEDITIISDKLRKDLEDFAKSLDSVDFDSYFDQLDKELTIADLNTLAGNVETIAANFGAGPDKDTLTKSAERLRELDTKTLPSMTEDVAVLKTSLKELNDTNNLKTQVLNLITELEDAQTKFNTNKATLIQDQIKIVADDILIRTNSSLERIKSKIRTDLMKCGRLSDSVYDMTDAVCIQALDPYNGLWFSFGWCLFFFLPTLIFATLLASQYRRELEYEKDFDEPNYQMYGGHSNDTIPLTSMDHPHNRHNGQAYPVYPSAPRQVGQTNSAYSPEPRSQFSPPPYDEHQRNEPGIAAYATSVPYGEMGHRHHDLSRAYPVLHADQKNTYHYPY